ncbi:Carbonate dehydratase [Pirellula staleyi DSM 6068]|uniref:Carbonic anhydrase n=1 Tax=Pirellula staleyi (strain ATCC 27377 / DSM 6068 / ICPB 4128) TaxID=530564 RepID=D2R267_PIRSD|nr:carbonic anhydrase [Pirellula staleyi]ADB18678.1 Carbonate dehydratase [Pirellula staleyi DSM 6068]
MEKILAGVHKFRRSVYPRDRQFFQQLSEKDQKPKALFITCSDSRVDPNLITQTEPGDLFLVRNAGNLVPPYAGIASGEAATIEYSIEVLGIKNIIVCGHSQCGAMRGLLNPQIAENLPAVKMWFNHAETTRRIVKNKYQNLAPQELIVAATEENVLVQLNNLSTHPAVAARLSAGEVRIFGWYYDIGSGCISQFDQQQGRFVELGAQAYATAPLPIRTNDETTSAVS